MPRANPPHPAKPLLCLQIGITGHRPDNLLDADYEVLQNQIAKVLSQLNHDYQHLAAEPATKHLYAEDEVLAPRLLSALAEGADRLAASAALQQGYDLHCPLPFDRELYATNFKTAESATEFSKLLAQAERILELDGERTHADQAYRSAGQLLVYHADVVVTIWNGIENRHSPGTAGMVAAARHLQKTLIWINAAAPHQIKILDPQTKSSDWQDEQPDSIRCLLAGQLLNDGTTKTGESTIGKFDLRRRWQQHYRRKQQSRHIYFNHPEPSRNPLSLIYRSLFNLLGKRSLRHLFGNAYRLDTLKEWEKIIHAGDPEHSDTQPPVSKPALPIAPSTGLHFVHADSLACYYAEQHRGSFVLSFGLGVFAVLAAMFGAPFKNSVADPHLSALVEFGLMLTISFLIIRGRYEALHQRWLDFRLLAECLRQHAFLAPIGGISKWQLPVFHNHNDDGLRWIDWLIRSIIRAEGIPGINLNTTNRQRYHDFLLALINNQAEYHRNNAKYNKKIAHSLHLLNRGLIYAILLICIGHFLLESGGENDNTDIVLSIFSATLPALGAAIAGILSQGEFSRIAHRSASMGDYLQEVATNLNTSHNLTVAELARQAQLTIELMSQELFDWRVIFRAKPLEQHA